MIEAKNLRKVYKTKKGVVVNALDGVSVKLPDTGMVFILGKSGSGKSTLLNVLGGLDSFDSGEIIIKGSSAKDFKQSHYDSYRNTYIGFIFQEYNVLEELTVGANVALAIELQGRKATDEEINAILTEVDLEGYGARKPNELSGGQKQRVAIARALVKKPEIIMADEPTGALDSATGKQVFDTLKKLSRDKLVVIVSHDREFSEQYADRIIELKDGVIISDVEKAGGATEEDFADDKEDSITYGDGEISLVPGYTLTEADRLAINEYLEAYAKGATIKVKSKEKKKVSSGDFVPTDESKIVSHKKGDFQLIKSSLSIKNAFKLGSGGLKHKKFRLVFTIFLSLISFTLFGLADTIAAYDNISTATSSIYDTGVDYASFIKEIKQGKGSDYEYWTNWDTVLTPADIETRKAQTGYDVVGVYKKNAQLSFSQSLGKNKPDGMEPQKLYSSAFSGITSISESVMNTYGFKLLEGTLPEADKNEIVITKYTYDYFTKVGYLGIDKEGKEVETEIKSEKDIIGKTLSLDLYYGGSNVYTISGVVDVNFDYSRYERIADSDAERKMNAIELMALQSELEAAISYSFASICFVDEKMISDIVADAANKPDSLYNASISYYLVNDDSIENPWEIYGEDGTNVIASQYFGSVYSLDKVKNNVFWFGSELSELADNQIIVGSEYLYNNLNYERLPEAWYNSEKLTGDEAELYGLHMNGMLPRYPSLQSILQDAPYFYAYSYAMDYPEKARAVVRAVCDGYTDEDFENSFPDNLSICNRFADIVSDPQNQNPNNVDTGITEADVVAYFNGLLAKYELNKCIMPEELAKKFYTTYEYKGAIYVSYDTSDFAFTQQYMDSRDMLISRRYAAENLDDAIAYYKAYKEATLPEDVGYDFSIEEAVNCYADYVNYKGGMHIVGNKPIDFTPSADAESYELYRVKILIDFYNPTEKTGKPVLSIDSYGTNYRAVIKNAEIVGIYVDTSSLQSSGEIYYGHSGAVFSENVINNVLGANRGGLYAFAVGKMPTDKGGINELVKFSKTYMNETGDVKYSLSNNVTQQLDMVDELLEVLGQVFLYVGIGFAVFASLMLANFISTSVTYKKQEIGILRAIGSRSSDVFRIFFAESFIIAMINFVTSVAGTLSVTIVLNNVLRNDAGILITFLNFGVRQVALLLLVSLAVAFVATFFPVKKIASMKPIDAIKNRK